MSSLPSKSLLILVSVKIPGLLICYSLGPFFSMRLPPEHGFHENHHSTWELLFDVLKVLLRDSSQYPLENRKEVVLGIHRGGSLVTGQSL